MTCTQEGRALYNHDLFLTQFCVFGINRWVKNAQAKQGCRRRLRAVRAWREAAREEGEEERRREGESEQACQLTMRQGLAI